jgi:hypothetical protein
VIKAVVGGGKLLISSAGVMLGRRCSEGLIEEVLPARRRLIYQTIVEFAVLEDVTNSICECSTSQRVSH